MNLDSLTIGEAKQLAAMFDKPSSQPHPFIGMNVIARCYAAGVHTGTVHSVEGENVILKNSVRLWSWKANDGVALSGVAQTGLKSGKLDTMNPVIYLTGVCELIPLASGIVIK